MILQVSDCYTFCPVTAAWRNAAWASPPLHLHPDKKSSAPNVGGLGVGQELRCLNVTWPQQEVPEEITRPTSDELVRRVQRSLSPPLVVAALS